MTTSCRSHRMAVILWSAFVVTESDHGSDRDQLCLGRGRAFDQAPTRLTTQCLVDRRLP